MPYLKVNVSVLEHNYLASNLKWLLKQDDITATELARRCKLAQPVVHRLVVGSISNPQINTLLQIVHYFNCNIDELLTENMMISQAQRKKSKTMQAHHRIKTSLETLNACIVGLEKILPLLIKYHIDVTKDSMLEPLSDEILTMLPKILAHSLNTTKNLQTDIDMIVRLEQP
jgi:hypothetical protein